MATRHNTCVNPSLKNNTTGWGGEAAPSRVSVTGFLRSFGARWTSGNFLQTAIGAVTGGGSATVSLYVKPTNAATGTFYIEWRNGGGSASYDSTAYSISGGAVTRLSLTRTAPADAVSASIIMDNVNFAFNTTDVTAVLVEQTGTLQDFFDGDSANASWDGTDGNSASTLVDSILGTVTINLGSLTSTASGVRGVTGVAAKNLGALTTAGAGVRGVTGTALVGLGGLATSAIGAPSETVVATGSWDTLLAITKEARQLAAAERSRPPVACPNDGELLQRHRGVLHCAFDGWTSS